MRARQKASRKVLVVKAADAADVGRRIAEFGSVEELDADGLLLLRLGEGEGELDAVRTEILERVDGVEWAEPLLVDEAGASMFPTGDVSVRFRERPSDDDLRRFAEEHGLELRRRNEFVPEQATFAPRERRREALPEKVSTLRRAAEVAEAWTNTASRYHRA